MSSAPVGTYAGAPCLRRQARGGFAGDPEWEKYMQMTGDAGLEIRVPAYEVRHVADPDAR